jgi:AcrR family transcriptional regulator
MNQKPIDRRVRKTKLLLRNGVAELLKSKPIQDIRVREITELVDISRGTFYLHYKDVYDMIEKIENEMIEEFNQLILSRELDSENEHTYSVLTDIFQYLADNSTISSVLLSNNGNITFLNKLKHVIQVNCLSDWINKFITQSSNFNEYYYSFVISGYLGIFETWLKNDMRETPEEMAILSERLIENGLKGLSQSR